MCSTVPVNIYKVNIVIEIKSEADVWQIEVDVDVEAADFENFEEFGDFERKRKKEKKRKKKQQEEEKKKKKKLVVVLRLHCPSL